MWILISLPSRSFCYGFTKYPNHPHRDETQTNPWLSRLVPTPNFLCQAWFPKTESVIYSPPPALTAIFTEGRSEKVCEPWQYKIHECFSCTKALGSVWCRTAELIYYAISRACMKWDERTWVGIVVVIDTACNIGSPSSSLISASAVMKNIPVKWD